MNTIISLEELESRVLELEKELEEMNSNFENSLETLDRVKTSIRLLKKQDEQLSKKRLV